MLSTGITSTTKRVWIPASQMYATSDATPATRQVFVTSEEAQEYDVWAFDAAATESVSFVTENLGRYISFDLLWTSTSASAGNVVWSVGGNSVNVGRTTDVAHTSLPDITSAHSGVAQTLNKGVFGPNRMGNGIAPQAPELGPISVWYITRRGSNGSDTLSGDALLIGAFAYFYG